MPSRTGEAAFRDHPFARLAARVTALGRHRVIVVSLVVASIAGALAVDLAIPSYPIAGFYLIPVTLAALTLRVRTAVAVGLLCLGLALWVIDLQDRWDGPTITVVCFSVLSGAALIALSYLFTQVGQLYEQERRTSARLESLAAQLQTLQEVVVLDTDRPLSDLLRQVIEQAGQLLGSDSCRVYRFDSDSGGLRVAAAAGEFPGEATTPAAGEGADARLPMPPPEAVARALEAREPVAASGGSAGGALLAVPLLVRGEAYGVLALGYREAREFGDLDVRLAGSFGAEVAMAIENARLRDEIGRAAAATERSRLARDLHDSVTQSLFAASLKAEAIRRRWEPTTEEARANVEDVERLARGALAEMRTLLMEMRPDTLTEASLQTLVEQLAAAVGGSSRVAVEFDVRPGEQPPPDVSVALFRIAQEALQNVSRHSGAGRAWVMLDMSGPVVCLIVRDDGHGFDEEKVTPEHFGLAMMRERAAEAGVTVAVESGPGSGTTVSARWRRGGAQS